MYIISRIRWKLYLFNYFIYIIYFIFILFNFILLIKRTEDDYLILKYNNKKLILKYKYFLRFKNLQIEKTFYEIFGCINVIYINHNKTFATIYTYIYDEMNEREMQIISLFED